MPSYVRAGIRKCARIRALSDRAGDITPMSRMGWDETGKITLVLPTVTGRNASRPYLWGRYQNAV